MPQDINRPDYPHSEDSNIPWEHTHSIHQRRLLIYRAHISATWYCTEFCNEWLTLNSLIIKSRLGGSGFEMLDQVASPLSLFPCNRWPKGFLLLCSQNGGWRSRVRRQHSWKCGGMSPPLMASHLVFSMSPCLHVPVLGCRSCTSVTAHINGGSFAKLPRDSSPHLLRSGFGLLPKTSSCQVCAPAGPGTIKDLTTKPFSGRFCANPVATQEFTHSCVVCTS